MTTNEKILDWFFTGFVGTSSKTLAAAAAGQEEIMHGFDRPHDADDFFRCMELVEKVPGVKLYFEKVKLICPEFGPIIDHWDELCGLFELDKKNSTDNCGALIRALSDECYIAGGWEKTRWGWTKEKKVPF
ncbi:hypothetical protein NVP1205O_58 [Vibrio phage 1.205.O._10N.222.51.A7]|nr:hypothetical protein NVP1205O_58 [Vibrio phage 1.205.O._10N.222.51.A7]